LSAEHHSVLAHHFENLEQQRESQSLGMWAFLGTEVLFFGTLLSAYAVYSMKYHKAFEAISGHLMLYVGAFNTLVLLGSSLTMVLAVHYCRVGNRKALINMLLATMLLGSVFLGIKAYEYYTDYVEQLVPRLAFNPQPWLDQGINPGEVQLFLMFYYILTGLHAIHMVIGMVIMGIMVHRARRGDYTAENYMPVEIIGLYWHFVDLVWIYLFPLLYLFGAGAGGHH
jgi:cytochrome c oxidase subunit 3